MSLSLLDDADFLPSALDDINALLEAFRAGLWLFGVDREDLEGDFAIFQVLQMSGCSELVKSDPITVLAGLTLLLRSYDIQDRGGEDHQGRRKFIAQKPELQNRSVDATADVSAVATGMSLHVRHCSWYTEYPGRPFRSR